LLRKVRVAICGELETAHTLLKEEGVHHIDRYSDALDLACNLQQGTSYDLILIYAPQGEGLIGTEYAYRERLMGDWITVPVRLLNEPACHSALVELKKTVREIAGAPYSPFLADA